MSNSDQSQRFLFEQTQVRGQLVGLHQAWQEVLSKHNYPEPVQNLLGQFMAASVLLSSTLKFEGSLILQAAGNGQVRSLMAECRNKTELRAIATYNDDFSAQGKILGEGQLAITVDPDKGQRYQGIVVLNDGQSLAKVLEDYFHKSDQIKTRIWLAADQQRAAGFMVQAMPISHDTSSLENHDDDLWDRVNILSDTLTDQELLELPNDRLLTRLFHEEEVRLYDPDDLAFHCTCSRERSGNAIRHLGEEDALALLAEQGVVATDCQFCHARYAFNEEEIKALFAAAKQSKH